jgi:hypothetical protein
MTYAGWATSSGDVRSVSVGARSGIVAVVVTVVGLSRVSTVLSWSVGSSGAMSARVSTSTGWASASMNAIRCAG